MNSEMPRGSMPSILILSHLDFLSFQINTEYISKLLDAYKRSVFDFSFLLFNIFLKIFFLKLFSTAGTTCVSL